MNARIARLANVAADGQGEAATAIARPDAEPPQPAAPVEPDAPLAWYVWLYLGAVAAGAAACIAYFVPQLSSAGWPGLVTLTVLGIVFERVGIRIYGETHVSAGVVALFAIAIVFGAPGAAIAAPLVVLAATAFTRSRWHHRLFDMSSYTLITVSAALVF